MSNTDQFWQYAKEAMLSASYARTGDERKVQLDLARIWTQAALLDSAAHVGSLRQPEELHRLDRLLARSLAE